MSEFFLQIVNMSISASWIVLAVLLLRLLLRKAPKWITVLLWGIVAVRLICPFSIESVLSLIPSTETISPGIMMEQTPEINTGIPIINNTLNPVIGESFAPTPEASANPLQIWIPVTAVAWCAGIAVLSAYTAVSYLRLRRKVGTAVLLRDNIFQSESVVSPFVLGIIRPKIYLPFKIGEQDMEHVVAHEQAHIRRKDHWWKPLGFLLLTLHWFNPLMWLGYVLLCRDIESACDEKVVKELDNEQRADYAQALLACSVNRRMIAACPLAFGEVGVKNRVQSVLNYKKPAFWIIIAAMIASVLAAVCFLTNPIGSNGLLKRIVNEKSYTVMKQENVKVTLSIPKSSLPDDIYSEEGHEFEKNEVIVYTNDTTTIYLKSAQFSNEGEDNLYFCFDFNYDLPKESGKLLYPYGIRDGGFSNNVGLIDGALRDQNMVYEGAVQERGQGNDELIWFYVSTDALKRAEGIVGFDIILNQITYLKDGADESSISNAGGVDSSAYAATSTIETLRIKYPMYFYLSTSKGLEVYVWQMAEGAYSCGLLPGKNRNYTQEELWSLHTASATMDEMREIVASYDIPQSDVIIRPVSMPHSSYAYIIDDAYCAKIEEMFWSGVEMDDGMPHDEKSKVID